MQYENMQWRVRRKFLALLKRRARCGHRMSSPLGIAVQNNLPPILSDRTQSPLVSVTLSVYLQWPSDHPQVSEHAAIVSGAARVSHTCSAGSRGGRFVTYDTEATTISCPAAGGPRPSWRFPIKEEMSSDGSPQPCRVRRLRHDRRVAMMADRAPRENTHR